MRRGPDWSWDDQDQGGLGTTIEAAEEDDCFKRVFLVLLLLMMLFFVAVCCSLLLFVGVNIFFMVSVKLKGLSISIDKIVCLFH